jgi:hypothetical protein
MWRPSLKCIGLVAFVASGAVGQLAANDQPIGRGDLVGLREVRFEVAVLGRPEALGMGDYLRERGVLELEKAGIGSVSGSSAAGSSKTPALLGSVLFAEHASCVFSVSLRLVEDAVVSRGGGKEGARIFPAVTWADSSCRVNANLEGVACRKKVEMCLERIIAQFASSLKPENHNE